MQRSADPAGAALGVERVSLFQRLWIQRDHRGQARTVLVVRLDAREVLLDKIVRGDGPDPLRAQQLDNGLLGDVEGGRRSRGRQRTDQTDLRPCGESQQRAESRGVLTTELPIRSATLTSSGDARNSAHSKASHVSPRCITDRDVARASESLSGHFADHRGG